MTRAHSRRASCRRSSLPSLIREDYVTNSNDSYWLSNPAQPLEGYSPIIGAERTARSLRTRAGLVMVNEVLQAKEGNKFDPERLQACCSIIATTALSWRSTMCSPSANANRRKSRCRLQSSTSDAPARFSRRGIARQDVASRGAQVWTRILAAGGEDAEPVAHAV